MRKLFSLFFMVILIIYCYQLKPMSASASAQEWKDYDIKTELKGLTAKKIDDYIVSKGHGKHSLANTGSVFIDISKKTGINAGVLLGMSINETGWGTSYLSQNFNNYGGVMCKTGYTCKFHGDRSWTVFDNKEESLRIQAELLMGKTYYGAGLNTIEKILLRYAPPGDNNDLYSDSGYMSIIGNTIKGLGYDSNGGTLNVAEGGEYTSSTKKATNTKVGSYESKNFYLVPKYNQNATTGVNDSNNYMPTSLTYSLQVFSERTVKVLSVIGVIFTAILVTYMSLVLILYTAVFRGITFKTKLLNTLTKFSDNDDIYSKKAMFKILGLCVFACIMIGIFLTGTHTVAMAFIYQKILDISSYIL